MNLKNVEFIFIPRTGTTTLITQLEKVDPIQFSYYYHHRTAVQARVLDPNFDNKFSFALIRNPFQRLVSIWQYDLKHELGRKNDSYKKFLDFNYWIANQVTHMEWIRAWMAMPQWYWVSDGNQILVKKLYRTEQYKESLTELSNIIGVSLDHTIVENKSMKQYNYKDIANTESKKIMLELCKLDCDKFNYDW